MEKKSMLSQMLLPTIFMGTLAVVFMAFALYRGQGEHVEGLRTGFRMVLPIIPLLFCAFVVAGLIQVMIPKDLVAKWVGTESGLRGIMLGSIAGSLTPGGPFVNLPIAMGLFKSGASVGCLVAFLTGWSLWAVNRLPMEVAFLGWKLTLIRLASVIVFPPLAGIIAQLFFARFAQTSGT